MNIVHIIGNGFDLNLGLKTSYTHFYEYYKNQESKNKTIKLLKKEIDSNIENWSDLELALGKFTAQITTIEEFEIIRQDIIINLSNYLKSIETSFDLSIVNTHELSIFLSSPHIELRNADKAVFEGLLNPIKHELSNVNIISFNYTTILDNLIIEFVNKTMSFAKAISSNTKINPVKHIHGLLDLGLIIGLNDNSQASNESFINNVDFKEAFIKTEYNKASSHLVDNECIDLLNNASIICVFGSSLGLSDKFWWELICDRLLKQNCKLIIYHKSFYAQDPRLYNLINKEIRVLKEKFLSNKPNLTSEEKEIIKQNIYININSNFFNILN